jgi:hypothetical protein
MSSKEAHPPSGEAARTVPKMAISSAGHGEASSYTTWSITFPKPSMSVTVDPLLEKFPFDISKTWYPLPL